MRKWRVAAVAAALVVCLAIAVPLRAAESTPDWRATLDSIISLVSMYYREPVDLDKLRRGAIRGALETLGDPYTAYLDPKEYADFTDTIQGNFTGIGIYIEQVDKYITVVAPIKGSPADKAGLKRGDRILEANGTSLVESSTEKASQEIRGPVNTPVKLKIERPAEGRVFEVTIVRAAIQIPIAEHEMLPGNVGYIRLHSFSSDAPERFRDAYTELRGQGATGIILDLRDNAGGYLDAAVRLAGYFVPNGEPVIHTVSRGNQKETEYARGEPIDIPAVVLVNKGSASASEILAGAIQDYKAAPLVGTVTFGKGVVQQLVNVPQGGVLKVTTSEYLTGKERRVHKVGLQPDVVVEEAEPDPERTRPVKLTTALTWGNVGLDVLAIQQRLNDLGYAAGAENGYFGGALMTAVQRFQKDSGLASNGVVDQATVARLNDRIQARVAQLKEQDIQREKAIEILNGLRSPAR